MISRRPANIERALQMDRNDGVEIVFRHTVEYLVAQDARIIDNKVNLAVLVDRLLYDAMRTLPISDTVTVRDSLATGVADLVHNLEGWPRICTLAANRAAQVVDNNFRTVRRHHHRIPTTDTAARAGYDSNLALKHL
jgi:hypothetical protein